MNDWSIIDTLPGGTSTPNVYRMKNTDGIYGIMKIMDFHQERDIHIALNDLSIRYPYFVRTLHEFKSKENNKYHLILEELDDIDAHLIADDLLLMRIHILMALYIAREELQFRHNDMQFLWRKCDTDTVNITYKDISICLPVLHLPFRCIPVLFDYGESSINRETFDDDLYNLLQIYRIKDLDSYIKRRYNSTYQYVSYDTSVIRDILFYLIDTYKDRYIIQ